MSKQNKHPMQPIVMVGDVVRFKQNDIIDYLFKSGKMDLNHLAQLKFSKEDWMQLAQLLGYSVSGFGDLSYADPKVVEKADKIAMKIFLKNEKKKEKKHAKN